MSTEKHVKKCIEQGLLAQSPKPEAHDKVLDNSRSNWNLEMLVFEERGKPEYPEKNLSEQGREPIVEQPGAVLFNPRVRKGLTTDSCRTSPTD